MPGLRRVRGRIRIVLEGEQGIEYALDAAGRHGWTPIAPCARIEVELERPRLAWRGRAYVDSNRGAAPLEADFHRWHWSRSELPDGRTLVFYDPEPRTGPVCAQALVFDRSGRCEPIEAPPLVALDRGWWGVDRAVRSEADAWVVRTLEDSPFYARSLVESRLLGRSAQGIQESLDLGRFARPWVQALIPFRAPRVA